MPHNESCETVRKKVGMKAGKLGRREGTTPRMKQVDRGQSSEARGREGMHWAGKAARQNVNSACAAAQPGS